MKKIFIAAAVLIGIVLMVLVLKGRKMTPPNSTVEANETTLALDQFLEKAPADPAAPLLRRLSAAFKAHPSVQNTVLGDVAARSVQDGTVSSQETVMLEEAAALAEQDQVTDPQLQAFSAKYVSVAQPNTVVASNMAAIAAIDTYLEKHPSGLGVELLRRLSIAIKQQPGHDPRLAAAAAGSIADGAVSSEDVPILQEAAALAEQDHVAEPQLKAFSEKYGTRVVVPDAAPASAPLASETIETYLHQHPKGRGVVPLRRLLIAHKARPAQTQVLADAAARSVQDGAISTPEVAMLKEAATLAEQTHLTSQQAKAFTAKHPVPGSSAPATASVARASSAIETYLKKHPSGRGTAPLRRLSAAMKARPAEMQKLAETVTRTIEDGSIAKEEAAMLEEAAAMAERGGLSPREMAEFSSKYEKGIGLSGKSATAKLGEKAPSAPLARFEGKRQLIYTFQGMVHCAPTPCTNIRVSVRVSANKWVETRQDGLNAEGGYFLQMPILSAVNEKVLWLLEAHDNDLRKAELNGERTTTDSDHDIIVKNNLLLNPVPK